MEALGLTPEQAAIVAERGRDVLVTAGAGSGKTRVLVERYVALLAECRIPEIAAVTFTDAAATEMRERVRRTVLTREDLSEHRSELDEAVIGTIHSLCRQILREYPVEAGIDPLARVLAEDEAEFELIAASMDALEEAAEADDGRALALREVGVYALSERLPQMVARRDEVMAAFGALPGDTPAAWAEHVHGLLDASASAAVDAARPQLVETVAWLRRAWAGGEDALSGRLATMLEVLGDPRDGDAEGLIERLRRARPDRIAGGSASNWLHDPQAVRDAMRSIVDVGKALDELPRWNEHDAIAIDALMALRAVFDDACRRYAARKRELVALDYLDLELEAGRLLRDHPEVAAESRARFRHLMVDEFQDTNPSQVALLRLLASDGADGRPRPHLFLVGDAKQAIYRFRGSDVRHFRRLHHEVEAAQGAVHLLTRSFRTHDPLVAILNELFASVLGDGEEEHAAPMQAMTGRGTESPAGPHLAVQPIGDRTPAGDRTSEYERRRVEADAVAAEIATLLGRGQLVWDRDDRSYRPARPRDVAILLRRIANVHLFEQALEARGIAYRTPAGAGFFTRQEVLDLTNLLGWLAEPDDAIALVGALRSPLFMVDDATLLALRGERWGWLAALREPPATLEEDVRSRCLHAATVLETLRDMAPTSPVDELLERALAMTAFEAAWAPLQGGDQALANIRKFVAIARTLAGRSLDEVVTYIRRRRDELVAREGQAVLDDSDAVRLLTIHGAKGLEFPIVFVPETHLPPRDSYEAVRWRTEDGIALTLAREQGSEERTRRRPGFYTHLLALDHVEEVAEHRRLFYVAATRAADALYLSGDDSGRGEHGWLALACDALSAGVPNGVDARPALPVDLDAIAGRAAPRPVLVPPEGEEEEFLPPLVARPRVIPLRSSTPVTALRAPGPDRLYVGHGDGLALLRGNLAHRAIEQWFTTGVRPELAALARTLDAQAETPTITSAAAEVDLMLDRFGASSLAATLRDPETQAHFELPFSWHWDGLPVHGTIDLAYEREGEWQILDFKTDEIGGRTLSEVAAPYLPQLALYAGALEQATGRPPTTGLLFLRTGELFEPTTSDLDASLAETRHRVDSAALLDQGVSREADPPG